MITQWNDRFGVRNDRSGVRTQKRKRPQFGGEKKQISYLKTKGHSNLAYNCELHVKYQLQQKLHMNPWTEESEIVTLNNCWMLI